MIYTLTQFYLYDFVNELMFPNNKAPELSVGSMIKDVDSRIKLFV